MKRLAVVLALLATACAALPTVSEEAGPDDAPTEARPSRFVIPPGDRIYPPAPVAPSGPAEAATQAFDDLIDVLDNEARTTGMLDSAITTLIDAGDVRHAWLLSDLMRFMSNQRSGILIDGFDQLTGIDLSDDPEIERRPWQVMANHLIAWETPAPPDYQRLKGGLYTRIDTTWAPMFGDADADVDWRMIVWRGVVADDRPLGDPDECERRCIAALDDPPLVAASDAGWYPDDQIVFGVTEGDETIAFPSNVMTVHQVVNITVGGRRLGVVYCALCGSAQAYHTDRVDGAVGEFVLRTSGLVNRSNKVVFDLDSGSAFDTFTGAAVTGPLRQAGVTLDQITVSVSTWGDWKNAHPGTMIIARDGGIGRTYPTDQEGRNDEGPNFPVGKIDPRHTPHEAVAGVVLDDGTTVAFVADAARAALAAGAPVELGDVSLTADGSGLVASVDGTELATHEAYWFAWSQFHPDTLVWPNDE